MSWWLTQPVYPYPGTGHWETIGNIPPFIPDKHHTIYRFNIKYLDDLLLFINDNYLTGYRLTRDYLYRKLIVPGSTSLILMRLNKIIGFIYSSPVVINDIECGYVDLMTVSHNQRNNGLAKILISAITNFSNKKHYIHKKDQTPLPFPYFFSTRHYSGNVNLNYKGHSIQLNETSPATINTVYNVYIAWLDSQPFRSLIDKDTFVSSESVKTFYIDDFIVSIAIFGFTYGFIRNIKIAEVFFINYSNFDYNLYQSLLFTLKKLDIEFLVVQNNSFFRDIIKKDKYLESMDLYLHSYNLYIPNTYSNIQLPVF